jgi:hypothetical protein
MRFRLVALLAAILVTPALAQISMQPMPRPVTLPPAATVQQDPDVATKVMTLDEAKAQIAKLRAEKRDLTLQLNDSTAKLNETLKTLTEWTTKGGNLVHAYCDGETLSRSSAGASEECSTSGYRCSPVEGTCRRSCNVTTDCAGYYVCDTAAHVCVHS